MEVLRIVAIRFINIAGRIQPIIVFFRTVFLGNERRDGFRSPEDFSHSRIRIGILAGIVIYCKSKVVFAVIIDSYDVAVDIMKLLAVKK